MATTRKARSHRPAWRAGLGLFCLMVAACGAPESAGVDPDGPVLERLEDAARREARQAKPRTVPPPAAVADAVRRFEGPDRERARLRLEEIVAGLAMPEYLKPLERKNAAEHSPDTAVKFYVRGRAAWRAGNRREAIDLLEKAHRLDPNAAHVLRLLGWVYFDFDNENQGGRMLQRAVRLEPDDPQSLYLLGRLAYRAQRWEEAIVTLSRAMGLGPRRDTDPSMSVLAPYYLSQSLLEAGYAAAGVELLTELLEEPVDPARANSMLRMLYRDLALLMRRMQALRVQAGDALCRLGRFDEAQRHYERVSGHPLYESDPMAARRAYALLSLGRNRSAQLTALQHLEQAEGSQPALELIRYVADHTGGPEAMASLIRRRYEAADHPAALALAMHALQGGPAGRRVLIEHLRRRPQDRAVLQKLAADLAGADRSSALVDLIVELIERRPESADDYARELFSRTDVATALKHLEDLPAAEAGKAPALYLRGAALVRSGRETEAQPLFDRALAADPDFLLPRLALIDLRVARGDHAGALALLDKLPEAASRPVLRRKRAEIHLAAAEHETALKVLDGLLQDRPQDLEVMILKATALRGLDRSEDAEQVLLRAMELEPDAEQVYAELFSLYETDFAQYAQRWLELQQQALRRIPASRVARVKTARILAERREFDEAEKLYRAVIEESLDDAHAEEALRMLVFRVYGPRNRWDEAQKFLESVSDRRPDDRRPIDLLGPVARELGKPEIYLQRLEAFLKRQPASFVSAMQLFEVYRIQDQNESALAALEMAANHLEPGVSADDVGRLAMSFVSLEHHERALQVIDRAIEHFPAKDKAELLYRKSNVYSVQDKLVEAEKVLLRVLELNPDHPVANNDLGYFWADQSRNLDRALAMTRKAVAARPQQGAYLDSLGWVLYKLGQFPESVRRLEEALTKEDGQHPVIFDHLGDALWRVGNRTGARRQWERALRVVEQLDDSSQEIRRLKQKLPLKLKAVDEDQDPAVAPLPQEKEPEVPAPSSQP